MNTDQTILDLRHKIHLLRSNLNKKSKSLDKLKYNKVLETLKHDIRVICKDKTLQPLDKLNKIYSITLK